MSNKTEAATVKKRVPASHIVAHIILIAGILIVAFPFFWMVVTSFKTDGEAMQIPPTILPKQWTVDAYRQIVSGLPFAKIYLNTILSTVVTTIGQVVICSMAAYAFARYEFPGKRFLFMLLLSVLMVPGQIFLIPQYTIIMIITCAHGETITMTLDTTLPRFYSRAFTVQGTRGMYMEDNHSIYLDSRDRKYDFSWREHWGNADGYRRDYEHPTWKRYLEGERRGGHGGMDWIEFEDFFAAVRDGAKVPLNVYDAASWMAITPLSEQSIAMGGMPAAIPDFTGGRWMKEAPWHPYLES
jgi:hypothetical protein